MQLVDDYTVIRRCLDLMCRTARWDWRKRKAEQAERALARIEAKR